MKTFQSLSSRFSATGPKRILSLDGGGIRGMISLAYLQRIESILKRRYQKENFKLSDYFDLIGGTSTGSIIASALACGYGVSEITKLYLNLGDDIFGKRNGILGLHLNHKYDASPLESALRDLFGDIRIGDEGQNGLKTGLCIITKRLDTNSTWPVTNHPNDIYFQRNQFLLRDLIRASTAAPSYFSPEVIDLGSGEIGTFVDGGLSMMNNPALQLFFISTVKGFPFQWDKGEDKLKIVSVGTGITRKPSHKSTNPNLLEIAQFAPEQLMHDAAELVEIMMQYFSDSPTARVIDRKFRDLKGEIAGNQASFSYLRYNIELQRETIEALGYSNISDNNLDELGKLDRAENKHTLYEIGMLSAEKCIDELHFSPQFDV